MIMFDLAVLNTLIGNSNQKRFPAQYSPILIQTHIHYINLKQLQALCMNDTVHFVKIKREITTGRNEAKKKK